MAPDRLMDEQARPVRTEVEETGPVRHYAVEDVYDELYESCFGEGRFSHGNLEREPRCHGVRDEVAERIPEMNGSGNNRETK